MKKILCLLLTLTMVFSLSACGGNADQTETVNKNISDKNETNAYIGTWETEQLRLVITKGGAGKWGFIIEDTDFDTTSFPISWEIKDEVLVANFSVAGFNYNAVFELNDSATTLNEIQKSGAFSGDVENDTKYIKIP